MLTCDFDAWQPSTINWKDESKNLQKLYPQVLDEGDIADFGSFFNFFTGTKDYADVCAIFLQSCGGG